MAELTLLGRPAAPAIWKRLTCWGHTRRVLVLKDPLLGQRIQDAGADVAGIGILAFRPGAKEEQLVLDDGAAHATAKFVELGDGTGEIARVVAPGIGVQHGVAEVLIETSVIRVAAAFAHDADAHGGSTVAAQIQLRRGNGHFRNVLNTWFDDGGAVAVAAAAEPVADALCAVEISGHDGATGHVVEGAAGAAIRTAGPARRQKRQTVCAAAVHRQVEDLFGVNAGRQRAGLSLHQRSFTCRHRDGFTGCAHFEGGFDVSLQAGSDHDGFENLCRKTSGGDPEFIRGSRNVREGILSVGLRGATADVVG